MRYVLLAVLTVIFFLSFSDNSGSQQEARIVLAPNTFIIPGGAVESGDALYLPRGDILNVRKIGSRNVQGGTPENPNLDLGAGSAQHRGSVSVNFDVGRCTYVYDGHATLATWHKHVIAAFCPGKRPWFNKPPRIGGTPPS